MMFYLKDRTIYPSEEIAKSVGPSLNSVLAVTVLSQKEQHILLSDGSVVSLH